jgi:hypothetical protein
MSAMAAASLPAIGARTLVDRSSDEFEAPSKASLRAIHAARARATSGRRRFVDPTTCERDYSAAELEFMWAMHEYKGRTGRQFPTWSEVLEVLAGLGYSKPCDASSEA